MSISDGVTVGLCASLGYGEAGAVTSWTGRKSGACGEAAEVRREGRGTGKDTDTDTQCSAVGVGRQTPCVMMAARQRGSAYVQTRRSDN